LDGNPNLNAHANTKRGLTVILVRASFKDISLNHYRLECDRRE